MQVYNHIFFNDRFPNPPADCTIPAAALERMRKEFSFWYPVDLRVSGKDLIQNHLIMSIYNHVAVWKDQPKFWPRAFFTNGHIGIDGEKMSKQKGNFLTIKQAVEKYSADATRFAIAEAGDGLNDSNFESKVVNKAILNLTKEEIWIKETFATLSTLREGPPTTFQDKVFESQINKAIIEADAFYSTMHFREAVRVGFHEMLYYRDQYRFNSTSLNR